MRRQEELRRMEEMHSQEVQKRKQLELRQEEERRRREEDMRLHNEDIMRRQQEAGFKGGNFQENVSLSLFFFLSLSPSPPSSSFLTHIRLRMCYIWQKNGSETFTHQFPSDSIIPKPVR